MTKRIVGAGEFTYEVIYPFGQMLTISPEGRITHVAVDSKDRVYAFLRAEVPILVFDPDGNLLTTWGEGLFLAGHGIYISPSDEVFLIDWDGHEVMKFDANGKLLLRFGNRGRPAFQAPFNHPADVAVAPSGEIYIADGYANSNVHRFSAEGKHLGSWGTPGSGPGQFSTPHGIWVDGNERVYVADRENSRVQIFSPEGDYLSEWGDLYHAMDIYQDRQGRFFVTDQTPRISVFNADGKLLSRGKAATTPHSIWGDSKDNLYVGYTGALTKYLKV